MGVKNYLIEGVSCTGKTTVGEALGGRGYQVIHGDRVLAYQGDPKTGEPTEGFGHAHHIWDEAKVRAIVADQTHGATFFCGGSRNHHRFIDLFDDVFILEVDLDTLKRRLDARPDEEWGAEPTAWGVMVRLHTTREDLPKKGTTIDSTAPVAQVVDTILAHAAIS